MRILALTNGTAVLLAIVAFVLQAQAQDVSLPASPSSSPLYGGSETPAPVVSSSLGSGGLSSSAPAAGSANSSSASAPPPELIKHTEAMLKLCPPKYVDLAALKGRAIPTNQWWGNIIAHDSSATIQPVWSNPFALQVVADLAPFGLAVSYPFRSRVSGGSSGNSGANRYYAHGFVREFMFSATEFTNSKPSFQVTDWADLGVTLQLKTGDSAVGVMESNLVSGMVYTTVKYKNLSPKLVSTATITSVSVDGKPVGDLSSMQGNVFEISYNSGQKWVLFALSPDGSAAQSLTLVKDGGDGSTLRASSPFDGLLRVSLAVEDAWIATLDKHKTCVVQGSELQIESDSKYAFAWKTGGDCSNGLLHFAMKHQTETLDANSATKVEGFETHSTTRGALQAFVTPRSSSPSGPVWTLTEPQEIPEGFFPAHRPSPAVVQEQRILEHLREDIKQQQWALPVGGSYYFNGKAAQKYASLCLLTSDPNVVGSSDGDKSLLTECLGKLRSVMAPFLTNAWTHKLQYDRVYGGVVSSEGFAKSDVGADFGNTMYNDHHFHYGYWLYTAALINYLDPTWTGLPQLNAMASLLARDVANFESSDAFFPRFRSFDWFRGHSYSHGVTPLADGKDQESTSEDVNFSFALYLYGKATGNERMATVGKLMTRVNAHAIKTYFLIEDATQVHPANFRANKVTGIFFDNKVDYATWFSAEKHCIHGIQMLPLSPVTPFVRSPQFVRQEWNEVLAKEPIVTREDTTNPWLSLLYANYATVDAASAMRVLQKTTMDDGLTRSWALYMAAALGAGASGNGTAQ